MADRPVEQLSGLRSALGIPGCPVGPLAKVFEIGALPGGSASAEIVTEPGLGEQHTRGRRQRAQKQHPANSGNRGPPPQQKDEKDEDHREKRDRDDAQPVHPTGDRRGARFAARLVAGDVFAVGHEQRRFDDRVDGQLGAGEDDQLPGRADRPGDPEPGVAEGPEPDEAASPLARAAGAQRLAPGVLGHAELERLLEPRRDDEDLGRAARRKTAYKDVPRTIAQEAVRTGPADPRGLGMVAQRDLERLDDLVERVGLSRRDLRGEQQREDAERWA